MNDRAVRKDASILQQAFLPKIREYALITSVIHKSIAIGFQGN